MPSWSWWLSIILGSNLYERRSNHFSVWIWLIPDPFVGPELRLCKVAVEHRLDMFDSKTGLFCVPLPPLLAQMYKAKKNLFRIILLLQHYCFIQWFQVFFGSFKGMYSLLLSVNLAFIKRVNQGFQWVCANNKLLNVNCHWIICSLEPRDNDI